jgi:hypothetical protein
VVPCALALTAAAALGGCGSSLLATSVTTATGSSTTVVPTTGAAAPPATGVAVAFPVVACTTGSGTAGGGGWKPQILLAAVPTTLVDKVEFYASGSRVVLAPTGWECAATVTPDGGTALAVTPPDAPPLPPSGPAPPGTVGVFATYDTTGRVPGVALVCPYFTVPAWQQQEANCSSVRPAGETVSMATPDVATVTDPTGDTGTLEGSGGFHPVSGTVLFPQVSPAAQEGTPLDVAALTCSLTDALLCPVITADFDVREFPAPTTG